MVREADRRSIRERWVGLDGSATQLGDCPYRPVIRAGATRLPFPDDRFGAVAALWMLYHLDQPERAIAEAQRVLRPGGLFVCSTNSRWSDPEIVPKGYRPTTFDAEDAPRLVQTVFGDVETVAWDEPMLELPDRGSVRDYIRSHLLPPEVADDVTPPVTVTKRGVLVWARKVG